ncbi:unnamed protein product [Larinioides sclopetarius]
MKNSTFSSCNGVPWQATILCLSLYFKDKMQAAIQEPEIIHDKAPKKLTEEAIFMIYIMLISAGLAILGSSVTAYEFFFQDKERKFESRKNGYKENASEIAISISKENKLSENHAFLESCKSFLKCFCVLKNGSKILSTTSTKGQIDCFHGMRFLGNVWVIVFHTEYTNIGLLRNIEEMRPLLDWRASQLLLNGGFSVDVFFAISGFLNAKAFFNKYRRSSGNISWFYFYFKRFIRLTPVYMLVLGFNTTLLSYTGTGILWPTFNTNPICQKDWWWYLLYINNFEESAKSCLPLCWYTAADMQLYIISPLFLVSLIRWPRLAYALIFACITGSSVTSFLLTYKYNLMDGYSRFEFHLDDLKNYTINYWEYFDTLYMKPYARIIPYLVGILLTDYLYKRDLNNGNGAKRLSTITLICGWSLTAVSMWTCFFSLYKKEEILIVTAIYNAIKYLLFSFILAWVIHLILTGHLEFFNKCLSWRFFFPLSRLSYCAYLIHPLILTRLSLQSQDFMDLSCTSTIWLYSYVFVLTYGVSFIASVLFEVPVLNLLDWFSEKKIKENSSVTSFCSIFNHVKHV